MTRDMTRDEARHWLEIELKLWEDECKSKHPIKEALGMVIKELEQEPVIDKVRAEIEAEIIPRNSDQYDYEAKWQNCGLRMALKAIDKYKSESEVKGELMTEVIKVEDCVSNIGDYDISIHNAIIIPKGVTNGDMIKALFPNIYIEECDYDIFTSLDGETRFTYDWWYALYKGESEGE